MVGAVRLRYRVFDIGPKHRAWENEIVRVSASGNVDRETEPEQKMNMEKNIIIEYLEAYTKLGWSGPNQKAFLEQQAKDARQVQCVRMRDVFNPAQMEFLRGVYRTKQKECFKNSSRLVNLLASWSTIPPVRYVEGFAYHPGLLPIEHAFVKIGDKYIDPTFERALHLDVRKELYVSVFECDFQKMANYLWRLGGYGGLYEFAWCLSNDPERASRMARFH